MCSNPFNRAKHTYFKRNLRPTTVRQVEHGRANNIALAVGTFLCNTCRRDVSRLIPAQVPVQNNAPNALADIAPDSDAEIMPDAEAGNAVIPGAGNSPDIVPMHIDELENSSEQTDMAITSRSGSGEYIDKIDFMNGLNKLVPLLGVEKIDIRKIEKSHSYCRNMTQEISSKLGEKIFGLSTLDTSTHSDVPDPNAEHEIVSQLKRKFTETSDKHVKVQILSVLPSTWSARKISKEFNTSKHMALLTKALVAENGILCEPKRRAATNYISQDVKNHVINFFLADNISQPCAGKREYVTIDENNQKVRKQRRLVLMNLEEAYALFKQENIGQKIGFSTFATLRPKECLLALHSCGTHAVCVCQYHQNVKLIFEPMKRMFNMDTYRDLFSKMMCNEPTDECWVMECDQCPGIDAMEQYLAGIIENNEIDDVSYKQWITQTGKSSAYLSNLCIAVK